MRIAVTGSMGQGGDLVDRAGGARVRDRLAWSRVFLLEDRAIVLAGLKAARPDLVINAAAYTVVDQGEAKESLAVAIGAPLLQLSTDYVFDGARPEKRLRSKLLGERRVAEHCANSVIVRTA
jgi:dTDP-4-dehydrorhamnose reductase